jgi:tetratricopeptide (TPR) repeat protein
MKYQTFLLFLLFSLLAFIIYSNSFNNEFVFDDIPLIVENHQINKIENIPRLMGLTGNMPYYRPLRIVSYVIDYYFFKLNPKGYHFSNILYHILTTFLVFLIARRLSGNVIIALTVSLLFMAHPVNTENVTYISGRRDILATLFYLLGFFIFLKYRETKKLILYPFIFLSYALALFSKEMAVTLPAVLFLYDFIEHLQASQNKHPENNSFTGLFVSVKGTLRKYFLFYLPFFIGGLAFTYYKVVVAPPSHGHDYYGGHLWTNFFTVARIIVYYIKLLLLPVVLNADYSFNAFPITDSLLDISAWGAILFILFFLWFAVKSFKRNRIITFSIFWFFITLLPVCHIFPHHELLAEHYLYLPCIGILFLMGIFLYNCLHKKSPSLFFACIVILLVLFSLRTYDRNKDWKNAMSLWEKTVTTAPDCARAWNNLGVERYQAGDIDNSEKSYRRAIEIKPEYSDPYHNLGNIMADRGLFDEARKYYIKAYKYCTVESKKIEILNSMGIVHKKTGNLKLAKQLFSSALSQNPNYPEALINMAAVLYDEGKYWKAWGTLMKALKIAPDSPEVHNNLGSVYKKRGDLPEAAAEFREAIRLKPDFMEAYNNLGNVLKSQGHYDEAIKSFELCLQLKPDSAEVYTNLGNTFRKSGNNEKAISAFSRALEINPQLALPHLNLAIIYLSGKKETEKALYHLRKTIELDPSIPQAEAIKNNIAKLEGKVR